MKKLNLYVDSDRLLYASLDAISVWGWSHNNQLGLTHRPGEMNSKERVHGECVRSKARPNKPGKIKMMEDYEISAFNPEFEGTYFEEVWDFLNHAIDPGIARMRLMMLPPMSCLSFHRDFEVRYHMALQTNESAFLLEGGQDYQVIEDGRVDPQLISSHIPNDGYVYELDGYKRHSAMNGNNSQERIHLVASLAIPYDETRH